MGGAFGSGGLGSHSIIPADVPSTMAGGSVMVIDPLKITVIRKAGTPQTAKPVTVPVLRQVPPPVVLASLSVDTGKRTKRPSGL